MGGFAYLNTSTKGFFATPENLDQGAHYLGSQFQRFRELKRLVHWMLWSKENSYDLSYESSKFKANLLLGTLQQLLAQLAGRKRDMAEQCCDFHYCLVHFISGFGCNIELSQIQNPFDKVRNLKRAKEIHTESS